MAIAGCFNPDYSNGYMTCEKGKCPDKFDCVDMNSYSKSKGCGAVNKICVGDENRDFVLKDLFPSLKACLGSSADGGPDGQPDPDNWMDSGTEAGYDAKADLSREGGQSDSGDLGGSDSSDAYVHSDNGLDSKIPKEASVSKEAGQPDSGDFGGPDSSDTSLPPDIGLDSKVSKEAGQPDSGPDTYVPPDASPDTQPNPDTMSPDQAVSSDSGPVCTTILQDVPNGLLCVPQGIDHESNGGTYKTIIINGTLKPKKCDPKDNYGRTLELIATDSFTIGVTGVIDGTGRGDLLGKGAGNQTGISGGGGYGSKGLGAGGGPVHGTMCGYDIEKGSGGSCITGTGAGRGGALIKISGKYVQHFGVIRSNGGLPSNKILCCPGSGAGVEVKATKSLSGNGTIETLGGTHTLCGGGDGRIKTDCNSGCNDSSTYKLFNGHGSNCKI